MINADKVKYARMNAGLGMCEVSKRTNISRTNLYRLERGKIKNPQAETIKKLSILYGKDIKFFYKEDEVNG